MKKTFEEILTFSNFAKGRTGQKTKLAYAIERVAKSYAAQTGQLEAAYREKIEDLDIEHCSVDDRGNIIEPMVFTKDALRARLKGQREARATLLKSEVEVEPYIATSLPADLTDAERAAFTGFVIAEETEEFTVQANGGGETLDAIPAS